MACSNSYTSRPVFVDTTMGTNIAVHVFSDITAKEFKGELERVHVKCFPEVGNITVKRLMVKKRSCYYQLSESLPLKYCFCGSNTTWFLHAIIANQINSSETESLNCKSANDVTPPVNHNSSSPCKKRKRKRKNKCKSTTAEVNCSQARDSRMVTGTLNENLSESMSVSGIIKKYFSYYDEVASNPCSNRKILNDGSGFVSPLTGPGFRVSRSLWDNKPTSEALGLKCKKPEVGRRLLQASENLGLSPNYKQFAISLCKFSNRKSAISKSSVAMRSLVFEIPEEGD